MTPDAQLTEAHVRLLISEAITAALEKHETKMKAHMDSGFGKLVETFESAFPGGDPHGHRLAHEKAIRDATGRDKLRSEVLGKFVTGGLWAAAGFLAFATWESVKAHLKGNP